MHSSMHNMQSTEAPRISALRPRIAPALQFSDHPTFDQVGQRASFSSGHGLQLVIQSLIQRQGNPWLAGGHGGRASYSECDEA